MKNKAMEARMNREILDFINSRKSLQLASLDEDGAPFASYAPFAADETSFYIVISDIAVHGRNLANDPRASVLVIEDEDNAGELFARLRVNYQVRAEQLVVKSEAWHHAVELLADRHGERPRNLSQLADFRVFRLNPVKGRYVKGFGKAYSLAGGALGMESINHLREGHRRRDEVEEAVPA